MKYNTLHTQDYVLFNHKRVTCVFKDAYGGIVLCLYWTGHMLGTDVLKSIVLETGSFGVADFIPNMVNFWSHKNMSTKDFRRFTNNKQKLEPFFCCCCCP